MANNQENFVAHPPQDILDAAAAVELPSLKLYAPPGQNPDPVPQNLEEILNTGGFENGGIYYEYSYGQLPGSNINRWSIIYMRNVAPEEFTFTTIKKHALRRPPAGALWQDEAVPDEFLGVQSTLPAHVINAQVHGLVGSTRRYFKIPAPAGAAGAAGAVGAALAPAGPGLARRNTRRRRTSRTRRMSRRQRVARRSRR